jgi:LysR family cyn operon transcriptional activator
MTIKADESRYNANFHILNIGKLDNLLVMEIRWLQSLVAVADEGGFANAASALQVAQPTVTGHIKDLERSLGVPLFDRRSRPVRLTDAGTAFIRHARLILAEVDSGLQSVRHERHGRVGGTVRLGTYASATIGYIPHLLQRAAEVIPDVTIVLHEMSASEMEAAEQSRQIDIFLRQAELPLLKRNYLTHRLWRERFYVAVHPSHPWARDPSPVIAAEELLHTKLIMTGRFAPEAIAAHPLWQALGAYPDILHRVVHPQSLLTLVETGLAPGLTTELPIKRFPTAAVLKPVDHPDAYREVFLYWPSRRPISPGVRALIDLIIAEPTPPILTPPA